MPKISKEGGPSGAEPVEPETEPVEPEAVEPEAVEAEPAEQPAEDGEAPEPAGDSEDVEENDGLSSTDSDGPENPDGGQSRRFF